MIFNQIKTVPKSCTAEAFDGGLFSGIADALCNDVLDEEDGKTTGRGMLSRGALKHHVSRQHATSRQQLPKHKRNSAVAKMLNHIETIYNVVTEPPTSFELSELFPTPPYPKPVLKLCCPAAGCTVPWSKIKKLDLHWETSVHDESYTLDWYVEHEPQDLLCHAQRAIGKRVPIAQTFFPFPCNWKPTGASSLFTADCNPRKGVYDALALVDTVRGSSSLRDVITGLGLKDTLDQLEHLISRSAMLSLVKPARWTSDYNTSILDALGESLLKLRLTKLQRTIQSYLSDAVQWLIRMLPASILASFTQQWV
jgi:hypothetical protein